MAKTRKFCAYRRLERPYTRISKFRHKSFIKTTPNINIVRFNMGAGNKKFGYTLELISKIDCQIRHNAFEAARQSSNRLLENTLGKRGYFLRIRTYPFHIMRENPLAAGAGADRMSTGMKHSFGNPIGSAARIKKGQIIAEIRVNKSSLDTAKTAMKRFGHKLPCGCQIVMKENPKK
ncbi:50S ribosomal protein L16 [Candidatus Woesearchaeota archaeon]|nr:50S ribosomal protein L16 [Candidatus Woesearchaeota archaeon]